MRSSSAGTSPTKLTDLLVMRDDGLVDMNESEIRVNQPGRLLVRNICSVFDLYLRTNNEKTGYSRAI